MMTLRRYLEKQSRWRLLYELTIGRRAYPRDYRAEPHNRHILREY